MIFVSIFSDITLLSTLFHCNAKQVSGKLLQLPRIKKGKFIWSYYSFFLKCYFFNDLLLLNFSHFHFEKKWKDDYSVTDISKHIRSFNQLLWSQLLQRSKWPEFGEPPLPPEVCQDISMRPSLSSCKNSILKFKKAGMITDLQLK